MQARGIHCQRSHSSTERGRVRRGGARSYHITTACTRPELAWMSSARLDACAVVCGRVMPGVRPLNLNGHGESNIRCEVPGDLFIISRHMPAHWIRRRSEPSSLVGGCLPNAAVEPQSNVFSRFLPRTRRFGLRCRLVFRWLRGGECFHQLPRREVVREGASLKIRARPNNGMHPTPRYGASHGS